MIPPKETYERLKTHRDMEDYAYTRLFENYLKYDLEDKDKLITLTSTDQESVLKQTYGNRPMQGMIYTFLHVNEKNIAQIHNYKTGKPVEFHDFIPLLFCTNYDVNKKIIKGINLNILPPIERVKFFEAYYNFYIRFLEKVEDLTQTNQVATNKSYIISAISGKNPKIFEAFNRSQDALFNFAYRSYKIDNIRKLRMIEYEEWQFIPFFNAKNSFKKINLDALYKLYYENKNKTK